MRNLYAKDVSSPPIIDKSAIQAHMIRYSGKTEKSSVVGSWDNWK